MEITWQEELARVQSNKDKQINRVMIINYLEGIVTRINNEYEKFNVNKSKKAYYEIKEGNTVVDLHLDVDNKIVITMENNKVSFEYSDGVSKSFYKIVISLENGYYKFMTFDEEGQNDEVSYDLEINAGILETVIGGVVKLNLRRFK